MPTKEEELKKGVLVTYYTKNFGTDNDTSIQLAELTLNGDHEAASQLLREKSDRSVVYNPNNLVFALHRDESFRNLIFKKYSRARNGAKKEEKDATTKREETKTPIEETKTPIKDFEKLKKGFHNKKNKPKR